VFVGGKKFVAIQMNDLPSSPLNNESSTSGSEIGGSSYRSVLFLNNGPLGMLYRTGENVIVKKSNGQQLLLNVTNFLSVSQGSEHGSYVRGKLYETIDEVDQSYGGSKIVRSSDEHVTLPASSILRKVMIYQINHLSSNYAVIDFLRPLSDFPITLQNVVVPVYPVTGDMVQICGENDDIWYGHILSVDERTKQCQVHFYVEEETCPGRYRRETHGHGRAARESIAWDSIIKWIDGNWECSCWIRHT